MRSIYLWELACWFYLIDCLNLGPKYYDYSSVLDNIWKEKKLQYFVRYSSSYLYLKYFENLSLFATIYKTYQMLQVITAINNIYLLSWGKKAKNCHENQTNSLRCDSVTERQRVKASLTRLNTKNVSPSESKLSFDITFSGSVVVAVVGL